MTTKTIKEVFRETTGSYKGKGLPKPIVVGICRGDVLTFRFAGQRKENAVEIPIDMAFEHALVRRAGLTIRDLKPQKRGLK